MVNKASEAVASDSCRRLVKNALVSRAYMSISETRARRCLSPRCVFLDVAAKHYRMLEGVMPLPMLPEGGRRNPPPPPERKRQGWWRPAPLPWCNHGS